MKCDVRSSPDSCKSDLFVSELLHILQLRPSDQRINQLFRRKPNRPGWHTPQGCAYRGRSNPGNVLDLAAAQCRVSDLRPDLNDFCLQSVGLKNLPLQSSDQWQAANSIVRVGDSDFPHYLLRTDRRGYKQSRKS